MEVLFDSNSHKNVMFFDLTKGDMIQANQHVIIDSTESMILDPGGSKVYSKLFSHLADVTNPNKLKYIFFSHQDPDIVSSSNSWFTITEANAFLSQLWIRFMHHFCIDDYVKNRITPIPDEGMTIKLGESELLVIPAHFLHSAGNFQVYDPVSKILYSGDLGASFGNDYVVVEDFDKHIPYIEDFHKRYIPCSGVIQKWLETIKNLDIQIIAPQHGAVYIGSSVKRFLEWLKVLRCGVEIM